MRCLRAVVLDDGRYLRGVGLRASGTRWSSRARTVLSPRPARYQGLVVHVLIAGNPAVRLTLRTIINTGDELSVVAEGQDGRSAVEQAPSAPLGVMGIHMPGTNSIKPARAAQTSRSALYQVPARPGATDRAKSAHIAFPYGLRGDGR
jgi:hypothetical protein